MRTITLSYISFYLLNADDTLPPCLPRDRAVGAYAIRPCNGQYEALRFVDYKTGWVRLGEALFQDENEAFNHARDHDLERYAETMKRLGIVRHNATINNIPYGIFLPAIQSKRI